MGGGRVNIIFSNCNYDCNTLGRSSDTLMRHSRILTEGWLSINMMNSERKNTRKNSEQDELSSACSGSSGIYLINKIKILVREKTTKKRKIRNVIEILKR